MRVQSAFDNHRNCCRRALAQRGGRNLWGCAVVGQNKRSSSTASAANSPTIRLPRPSALGSPATATCEEATRLQAQTIVVGNRRVQGVTRVLGSVAADVTKHAPCDVLIANTTEADQSCVSGAGRVGTDR